MSRLTNQAEFLSSDKHDTWKENQRYKIILQYWFLVLTEFTTE